MSHIFLTGLYRSGTTLLQQILDRSPEVSVLNQGLTPLFLHQKQRFLTQKKIPSSIPMTPMLGDMGYSREEWLGFLQQENFQKKYTEGLQSIIEIPTKIMGTKEIVCEEYIPYLLSQGIRIVLIVRDIRDVLCSLNFGNGQEFMGANRPTLFHIQNWRKSTAFAIHYIENPSFLVLRYEDLVGNPEEKINKMTKFLGVDSPNLNEQKKLDSNSSFGKLSGISAQSVGNWKSLIQSPQLLEYIEALCAPELEYFNYETTHKDLSETDFERLLCSFEEPFKITHRHFEPNYSTATKQITLELKRYKQLRGGGETDPEPYFIFPDVLDTLQSR